MQARSLLTDEFLTQLETANDQVEQFVTAFALDKAKVDEEITIIKKAFAEIKAMQSDPADEYVMDAQGRRVRNPKIDPKVFICLADCLAEKLSSMMQNLAPSDSQAELELRKRFTLLVDSLRDCVSLHAGKIPTDDSDVAPGQSAGNIEVIEQKQTEKVESLPVLNALNDRQPNDSTKKPKVPKPPKAPKPAMPLPTWRKVLAGVGIAVGAVLVIASIAVSATGLGATLGIPGVVFGIAMIVGLSSVLGFSGMVVHNHYHKRDETERYKRDVIEYNWKLPAYHAKLKSNKPADYSFGKGTNLKPEFVLSQRKINPSEGPTSPSSNGFFSASSQSRTLAEPKLDVSLANKLKQG